MDGVNDRPYLQGPRIADVILDAKYNELQRVSPGGVRVGGLWDRGGNQINVKAYGAKGDVLVDVAGPSISKGATALTVSGAAFTQDDVGKRLSLHSAVPTTTLTAGLPELRPPTTGAPQNNVAVASIAVTSTAGWPAAGSARISEASGEPEIIDYTGITGSALTGCTRASHGINGAPAHAIGKVITCLTAGYTSTIASVTDATHVVLQDAAPMTLAGGTAEYGTDDTTALQAAIAAIPGPGHTLFIPPGIYYTLQTLSVTVPRTVVQGVGWTSQLRALPQSPGAGYRMDGLVLLEAGSVASRASDLAVHGNSGGWGLGAQSGIILADSHQQAVHCEASYTDVFGIIATTNHLTYPAYTTDTLITHCYVHDVGWAATFPGAIILFGTLDPNHAIDSALRVDARPTNVRITNNHVENNYQHDGRPFYSVGAIAGDGSNVLFAHNTLINNLNYGGQLGDTGQAGLTRAWRILGNYFEINNECLGFAGGTNDDDWHQHTSAFEFTGKGYVISGNQCAGVSKTAAFVNFSPQLVVAGVYVTCIAGQAQIVGNTFLGNGAAATSGVRHVRPASVLHGHVEDVTIAGNFFYNLPQALDYQATDGSGNDNIALRWQVYQNNFSASATPLPTAARGATSWWGNQGLPDNVLDFGNYGFGTGFFGGADRTLAVAEVNTVPTSNPAGAFFLYGSAGKVYVRTTGGVIQQIAPAPALIDHSHRTAGTDGGPLTSPKIVTNLNDTNGNIWLGVSATPSAVDYLRLNNAAAGGTPTLSIDGTSTNVSMEIDAKGTGRVFTGSGLTVLTGGAIVNTGGLTVSAGTTALKATNIVGAFAQSGGTTSHAGGTFAQTGGSAAFGANDLFVDETNHRVGINTGLPQEDLDINGIQRFESAAATPVFDSNTRLWQKSGFGFVFDGFNVGIYAGGGPMRHEGIRVITDGSNGMVGINLNNANAPWPGTNPSHILHVNGIPRFDSTISTTAAAGSATALPGLPAGYLKINIGGTDRWFPFFA